MTAPLTIADAEYAVREWSRGLTAIKALVGGRVDLHTPRSPNAAHIVLNRVGGAPDPAETLVFDEPLIQATCAAPTGHEANKLARTWASEVQALNGNPVRMGADADRGAAWCTGGHVESLTRAPGWTRDRAVYQVTARFRLHAVTA